jgi:hypothetical protein
VPPTLTAVAGTAVAESHLHSVALVRERSSEQQATYRAVWVQSNHSAVHAAATAAEWSRRLTLELHPVPGTAAAATAGDSAEKRSSVEVGFAVLLTELSAPPCALLGCPAGVWAVGVNACSSTALYMSFATGRMQTVSLCTTNDSSSAASQAVKESVNTAAGDDKSVHEHAHEQLNGHLKGDAAVATQTGSAEQTTALFAVHKVRLSSCF